MELLINKLLIEGLISEDEYIKIAHDHLFNIPFKNTIQEIDSFKLKRNLAIGAGVLTLGALTAYLIKKGMSPKAAKKAAERYFKVRNKSTMKIKVQYKKVKPVQKPKPKVKPVQKPKVKVKTKTVKKGPLMISSTAGKEDKMDKLLGKYFKKDKTGTYTI